MGREKNSKYLNKRAGKVRKQWECPGTDPLQQIAKVSLQNLPATNFLPVDEPFHVHQSDNCKEAEKNVHFNHQGTRDGPKLSAPPFLHQTIRTPFLHQTIRTLFLHQTIRTLFLQQTIRTFQILTSRKLSNQTQPDLAYPCA